MKFYNRYHASNTEHQRSYSVLRCSGNSFTVCRAFSVLQPNASLAAYYPVAKCTKVVAATSHYRLIIRPLWRGIYQLVRIFPSYRISLTSNNFYVEIWRVREEVKQDSMLGIWVKYFVSPKKLKSKRFLWFVLRC